MKSLNFLAQRRDVSATVYQLTDRLHQERTAHVAADEIVATVSAWLAELDVNSPLVDDLARRMRNGDWPAAYAIADRLSVDVSVAA